MARTELKYQKHIIDSYGLCDGFAAKWASEWQKGPPDLICSVPAFGCHLVEVKHLPDFGNKRITIKNPMTEMQQKWARDYKNAGTKVFLAIVRGHDALTSQITYVDPTQCRVDPGLVTWWDYVPGVKYPINRILSRTWRT